MSESVIVLGGTGFVGTHICATFRAAGYQVISVSRGRTWSVPRLDDLATVHFDLEVAGGELAALLLAVRPDVVVNAVGLSRGSDGRMRAVNARLVDRLVATLASLPRSVRLVQLGSAHEYGQHPRGISVSENEIPSPQSVYGRTKLAGTAAVLRAAHVGEVRGVVLRLANVTGPGAPEDSLTGAVARRLVTASTRVPVELKVTPLRDWRDFVDVRDVASAAFLAASPDRAVTGQVLNIGRGEAVPVRWLVERLIALAGVPVKLSESFPGNGAGSPRENLNWQLLDVSRAHRLLGWRASIELEESLADLLMSMAAAPSHVAESHFGDYD